MTTPVITYIAKPYISSVRFTPFICLFDEILFSLLSIANDYGRFPIHSCSRDEAEDIDNCEVHFIGRSFAILFPKSHFPPGWNSGETHIAGGEIQLPSAITIAHAENSLASGDPRNSQIQLLPHFRRPSSRNPRLLTIDFSQAFAFPPQGNDFLLTEILFSHYEESHYPQAVYMGFPSFKTGSIWLIGSVDLFLQNLRSNALYFERSFLSKKRKIFR